LREIRVATDGSPTPIDGRMQEEAGATIVYIYPFKNRLSECLVLVAELSERDGRVLSPRSVILDTFGYSKVAELMISQVNCLMEMEGNVLRFDAEKPVGWLIAYSMLTRVSITAGDVSALWEQVVGFTLDVLSTELLSPIGHLLPAEDGHPIVLVPFGHLSIIPLHAMKLPEGRYLCDRFRITYAPSSLFIKRGSKAIPPYGSDISVLGFRASTRS
jgi:hypothetical protein